MAEQTTLPKLEAKRGRSLVALLRVRAALIRIWGDRACLARFLRVTTFQISLLGLRPTWPERSTICALQA